MTPPWDVLFVSDARVFGGAEIAMTTAAAALAKRGHHVSVGVPGDLARLQAHASTLSAANVRVLRPRGALAAPRLGFLSAHVRRLSAYRAARLLAAAPSRWVIVNLPTVELGAAVADAVLRATPRPRLAGYLHLGQDPSILGARYFASIRDTLWPRHLSRFDRLLAVSPATADQVAERIRRPVHAVYPGCAAIAAPSTGDRTSARVRLGITGDRVVGVIGRVDFHQKGQDIAVYVARRLAEAGAGARFLVIGDGPDLDRLRGVVAANGVTERFTFIGWRNDVASLLPALDALLMPSRFEGLPLTAIEAIAVGVPVVAYAVDGLAEVVPPPFGVPYGDVAALTLALRHALERPADWPAAAQQALARRLCDPDTVADRIAAALDLDQ